MAIVTTEAKMATKKGSKQRTGTIEITKTAWEGGKEQVVAVSHETVPQTKEASIWSWHEEFVVAWSGTFITKKRNKTQKKENDYEHLCRQPIIRRKRRNNSRSF